MGTFKVSAFGALNNDSYEMFAQYLTAKAREAGLDVTLTSAGPYPNAEAITVPGRPLRGDALKDESKKEELFIAVADDAKKAGADDADLLCMPCMSMIGFHDGVEQALGRKIFRLSDALKDHYRDIDRVGVIHMRPAAKRIAEIFGDKALTPDEAQAEALLKAEEAAKAQNTSAPVESVMKTLTETWRDEGLSHVLFARADAPKADSGPAGSVTGIRIDSTFGVLADALIAQLKKGP